MQPSWDTALQIYNTITCLGHTLLNCSSLPPLYLDHLPDEPGSVPGVLDPTVLPPLEGQADLPHGIGQALGPPPGGQVVLWTVLMLPVSERKLMLQVLWPCDLK